MHSIRPFLAVCAAVLVPAALLQAPAQGLPRTTLTARIVDTAGDPIRGVAVTVRKVGADRSVHGQTSDDDGRLSGRQVGQLSGGYWYVAAYDPAERFTPTFVKKKLVTGGGNDVGDIVMTPGGEVTGVVTAPSGARLKNVHVLGLGADGELPDEEFFQYVHDDTDVDGSFAVGGLSEGVHRVSASFDGTTIAKKSARFTVGAPVGPREGPAPRIVTIAGLRVPVTQTARAAVRAGGSVRLTVRASATRYGLPVVKGAFDVYDGGRLIRAGISLQAGQRSLLLRGLRKGRHTLLVRYLGATDTRAGTSTKVAVRIR